MPFNAGSGNAIKRIYVKVLEYILLVKSPPQYATKQVCFAFEKGRTVRIYKAVWKTISVSGRYR